MPGEIFQTLPDTKCHNWCKFKWPQPWSRRILRFCQKYYSPYRLGAKKKTISAGVKVSKSRKCISCLHRRSWNSCESVTKTHFHLHFPANYLLVGRCEPGSWTGDSVPGLPRWDKTQGVTPSWSQHELEVVLSCLDRNVTFTRLKFCQLNAIHGESSEGGGSVRQVLWREREG